MSKPEMEFHMINITYAALHMRAQTKKTTFSCKDDCTLTKHTRRWTYSALRYFFVMKLSLWICKITFLNDTTNSLYNSISYIWYFLKINLLMQSILSICNARHTSEQLKKRVKIKPHFKRDSYFWHLIKCRINDHSK